MQATLQVFGEFGWKVKHYRWNIWSTLGRMVPLGLYDPLKVDKSHLKLRRKWYIEGGLFWWDIDHHHHHHHDNDHQYKGSHFDLADMPRGGSSTATQGFPVLPLARNVLLILSPVSWSTVFLYSVFFYILQLAHNVLILSCIIQLYFSQIQFPVCIS